MSSLGKGKIAAVENVDESMLWEMVDVDTLQALLESFGQVCGVGAGIFTPGGTRIGNPAHHSPFCSLLYCTKEGRARCAKSDTEKIEDIKRLGGTATNPYTCHAGLIDFCEPIFCHVGGKERLIGLFFAGQVLFEEDKMKGTTIQRLRKLAVDCKVDADELLAAYMQVPRVPRERIDEIRKWIEQFTKLIGSLVEKRAAAQRLLLEVIASADNQNALVEAVQRHLEAGAVSVFLERDDVPTEFADRIFLVATTSKELASRLSVQVEEDIEKICYRLDEGFTGWVYKTGRVLHVPNVRDKSVYPQYPYPPKWKHKVKEIPEWRESQAFLGVPIRSGDGNVIGVIRAVRLKDEPGFTNDEIELLTGIASLVGAAVSTAQLYKKHSEKIEALKRAQALLRTLTETDTTLDGITNSMVEELGKTYVKTGKWEAVYVLQHIKSSKQFRIVASFPSVLPDKYMGSPFPDTEGVAGHVLETRETFASQNCEESGVTPTTPWSSVICAPIFHAGEVWGNVSLCGDRLSQTTVELASPRITQFADDMSLVCRLSEILDAKNAATLVASNVLSLNLEAHEVYKSLEGAKKAVDNLSTRIRGEERKIAEDLAREIDESLSWADVCLELGRYVELCQIKPGAAIDMFRKKHLATQEKEDPGDGSEHAWEEVDIMKVAVSALDSVKTLAETHKARVSHLFRDPGFVVGDENLLYRAFRNLLENAIVRGSAVKGKEIEYRRGVRIRFSAGSIDNGKATEILVDDDGVGMDSKALAAAKEIYADPTLLGSSSLAPGFGTMIVAFAVAVHGGHISLESALGKGTHVRIEVPSYGKQGE